MKKKCPWAMYENRLARVTAYIHANLGEELDMARLAEIACLSPYHWHRIYRAVHGETLAQTVRRLRLERAAEALAGSKRSVGAIAAENGYPNIQSFSRTFKAAFGIGPQDFRRKGGQVFLHPPIIEGDNAMYDVIFRDQQPVQAIGLDHAGPYIEIGRAFQSLGALLGPRGLLRPGLGMFAVYYDDPDSGDPALLRSTACFSSADDSAVIEAPLRRLEIDGGRYAVLTHRGPYSGLHLAYQWLYRNWLGQSGVEVRNAPPVEIYLNTPMDAAPEDLLTEICIPVA